MQGGRLLNQGLIRPDTDNDTFQCEPEPLSIYERKALHYIRANFVLTTITTVTAIIGTTATVLALGWGWTQHYLLYRRNHIHHRQVAREEARKRKSRARQQSRFRPRSAAAVTSAAESCIEYPEPVYRRHTTDLQRELETILNEARARQERLRVTFTMQELEAALDICPQVAPAA